MMDQLFGFLPKGFFGGLQHQPQESQAAPAPRMTPRHEVIPPICRAVDITANDSMEESNSSALDTMLSSSSSADAMEEDRLRKRARSGSTTPSLVASRRLSGSFSEDDDDVSLRPVKRFRGDKREVAITSSLTATSLFAEQKAAEKALEDAKKQSPLSFLPDDMLSQCLGFLGSASDRFALQATSKKFMMLSNSHNMLKDVQVGGDRETGKHGIIREDDTLETASTKLEPYVEAGNLEAIYMLGIIQSYCHEGVDDGVALLAKAATRGYVRASYALGLILRDADFKCAAAHMDMAAQAGYLPALHEVLSTRQMKEKFGEPKADELRRHLDPLCLNRLLARHYVNSDDLRTKNTSHCWNPLCGRWAFRSTGSPGAQDGPQVVWPPGRVSRQHNHATRAALRQQMQQQNNDFASFAQQYHEQRHHRRQHAQPPSHRHWYSHDAHQVPSPVADASSDAQLPSSRVSRMKMCSRCCRAKYCSKLCQVYDWRSGRHKMECHFL